MLLGRLPALRRGYPGRAGAGRSRVRPLYLLQDHCRDEPKDIFDLFTIFRIQGPDQGADWPTIMAAAAQKCPVDPEELRFRLQSFPLALLDTLPVSDQDFLAEMKGNYPQFVEYLLNAF